MIKFASLAFILLATAGAAGAADTPAAPATAGPQELVETSAKRMLAELDANRATYAKDSAKLDQLVATVLLPNFDSEYAARLTLGQNWRTATPDQRKRFTDAFYHSLLRNYGAALVDFTADRFKVLPYKGDPNEQLATVKTEVTRSSGDKVPVNFTLHKTDSGWKAFDVTIEGISYVKSFRTDFGAEIQQKGPRRGDHPSRDRGQARPRRAAESTLIGDSTRATFETLEVDRSRVVGSLNFSSVSALLETGTKAIEGGRAAIIDLGGITESDSSGLATTGRVAECCA